MTLESLVERHGDRLYEVLDSLQLSDKDSFSDDEVAQIEATLNQGTVEDAPKQKTKKVSKSALKQQEKQSKSEGAIAASTKALAKAAVQSGAKDGGQLGAIRNRAKAQAFLEEAARGDAEFLASIAGMDDAVSQLLDVGATEALDDEDSDFLLTPTMRGFSIL